MAQRIQLRRDSAANWALANPILASGECGFDETNSTIRIGDGVNHWTDLTNLIHVHLNAEILSATTAAFTDEIASAIVENTHVLNFGASTSLISGGEISLNADPTKFDIAAGVGVVVDSFTNPAVASRTLVVWTAKIGLSVPNIATQDSSYISIDIHGDVGYADDISSPENRRSVFDIGWVDHPDRTSLSACGTQPSYAASVYSQLQDFTQAVGTFNISGNIYSPATGLGVSRSAGKTFSTNENYKNDKKSPHILDTAAESPAALLYSFRTSTPGEWDNSSALVNVVDPDHYDDGSGTLASVPTGYWTIQIMSLYAGYSANDIQYGQRVYTTKEAALSDIANTVEMNSWNWDFDTYRGLLIVKQGATDLSDSSEALFLNGGDTGIKDLITSPNRYLEYHNHQAGLDGALPGVTLGTGGDAGKFSIATGDVWFFSDANKQSMVLVTIAGGSMLTPVDDQTGYVCADKVTATWVILNSLDSIDYLRYIPRFIVIKRSGSTALHFQDIAIPAHGQVENNHLRGIASEYKYAREIGALSSISIDASLNITASGGRVWIGDYRYNIEDVTTATRSFVCENTGSGFTITSALGPVLANTQYNGPTGFATLTDTYWGTVYLFRGIEEDDHLYLVYGNAEYASAALAQAANALPALPELITSHSMFVGRVIYQESTTTGFVIESAFTNVFAGASAVTSHGALSGLSNDDHTQYQLKTQKGSADGYCGLSSDSKVPGANQRYGTVANTACAGNDGRLTEDKVAAALRNATGTVSVSAAAAPIAGQVLGASSPTAAAWVTPLSVTDTAPANVTKSSAVVGVATTAARSDHKHDVSTATPVTTGYANSEGDSTSLARANHVHAVSLTESGVTATGTITTTSTTPVLATDMTITPAAGKYLCFFTGAGNITTAGASNFLETCIYAGGALAPDSLCQFSDVNNYHIQFCNVARVVVDGTQAIEGRWRRSGVGAGTAYMKSTRSLQIVRIG